MEYHYPPFAISLLLESDYDLIDLWEMGVQFDPHNSVMLWYDVWINRFIDECGNIIHDIHRFLHPWQIRLFKESQENCVYPDVTGKYLIELVYPDYMYTRHS